MKHLPKFLFTAVIFLGLGAGLGGCVGGYIEADSGPGYGRYPGYYGHDRWYNDGPWMSGPRGYIGIEIHPLRPFGHRRR